MDDDGELSLVTAILAGDRAALGRLVAREHSWLVRLARSVVKDAATSDEVVQDAWVAVIRALPSFEGRSSLRTWMATIVLNRARTVASRSARTVAVASLGADPSDDAEVADPAAYGSIGFFRRAPELWHDRTPEDILGRRQALEAVGRALEELPENQRAVVSLRDIEGWSSEEVCNALGLSESNQRVLLHRARTKLRAALHAVLEKETSS
ncbi:MAG: sigma-70 family RNA polymerase sigma factor [Polyangiaceae bacterium]